ncbi:MAG TPA: PQQ-binding-like beta-propeller repeat protein, partial [Planctomycetaceae bacterium]|nr:PQQ-binding-like beta-propeller repeat protein [Planctomycetaceae bacterium]
GYDRTAARLTANSVTEPQSDATAPWHYALHSWSREISSEERPLALAGVPPADQLACVLLAGPMLTAVDRITGAERWRQPQGSPPVWAGYGETNLLLAAKGRLSAVSLESGEPLWHKTIDGLLKSDQPPCQQFAATAARLIVFDPARGVTAISSITGDEQWEFRPPRGQLQSRWTMLDEKLVLQTLDPAEFWFVDASTGQLLRAIPGISQAWQHPPVDLGGERIGFVTADRQVWGWGPGGKAKWKFRRGLSHAHADPWLIAHGDRLALLIDGSTLVGIDPADGERKWGTGLADLPVTDPARQVAVCQGLAVTAWQSRIRAVALEGGRIAWESALPSGVMDWTLKTWCGQIAAMGTAASPTPHAVLLLFDAATGHPRQMWKLSCAATGGDWVLDDEGVLWLSRSEITAWEPMESMPPINSERGASAP